MSKNNLIISMVLNISIVVTEIIGSVESVTAHGAGMFQFYTEDSNLLALIVSLIYVICCAKTLIKGETIVPKWVHILRYISVCLLTVTFVVVICVLSPMNGIEGYKMMMLQGSMLYHHFLCPVVAFVSFVWFENKPEIEKKHGVLALIPTVIYAATAVILNIAKVMVGPYPFLRVYDQPIFMSVVWCVVILGGAYLFTQIIRLLNCKFGK